MLRCAIVVTARVFEQGNRQSLWSGRLSKHTRRPRHSDGMSALCKNADVHHVACDAVPGLNVAKVNGKVQHLVDCVPTPHTHLEPRTGLHPRVVQILTAALRPAEQLHLTVHTAAQSNVACTTASIRRRLMLLCATSPLKYC